MRVFAGVLPPADVCSELAHLLEPAISIHSDLAWIPPPSWHLTLVFFGELTFEESVLLNGAIAQVIRGRRAPVVKLAGPGAYPQATAAQELFIGAKCADDELANLRQALIEALHPFQWLRDERTYRQHIGLARADRPSDVSDIIEVLNTYESPSWAVTSVAVVSTRSPGDGENIYEHLAEHSFG